MPMPVRWYDFVVSLSLLLFDPAMWSCVVLANVRDLLMKEWLLCCCRSTYAGTNTAVWTNAWAAIGAHLVPVSRIVFIIERNDVFFILN